MGGKASSDSQSFESFVKENQDDFFNELSHQNKKYNFEDINQSMIKTFQSLKYLIILTEKLQTVQFSWNKVDFSVCILNVTNVPIQVNQYMKCTFKSFSFGIIRLNPIACSHIIFFLNKSKVFLTIQEFLNRILISLNPNDDELSPFIMSRKSKPVKRALKLEFPNPFLEPSLEPDLFQSSSCAFSQASQSDISIDSDVPFQSQVKKNINNISSPIRSDKNKEESPPLLEEIESYNYDQTSSFIPILTSKAKNSIKSTKKKKMPKKRKRSPAKSNKHDQPRIKKQFSIKRDDYEDDYNYYSDDNDNINAISTKSQSPPLIKENRSEKLKKKEITTQKSETDHLSTLFNFSMADSQSAYNRGKSTDICIDFYDQSSSTNIQNIKNWLPKSNYNDNSEINQNKNLILKNRKKRKSTPQKSNQNSILRNKSVHINLGSDFDKSIHLNENKPKRAVSSPKRKQKKKIVKSSPQKNSSNSKSALGALTSDFEMNSPISKRASFLTFEHDFNNSYEEESSSDYEIHPHSNSKVLNNSLVNNTSRDIKNNNSNESDNNVDFNDEIESNSIINSNKNEEKTRIHRRRKRIQNQKENDNETTNYLESNLNLNSNQQTDNEMNQNLQLKIPRIYEKRSIQIFKEEEFEQLESDFGLSTSSVVHNEKIFQTQNSNLHDNQPNRNSQIRNLISSRALGQLASDFDTSASSAIRNQEKSLQQENRKEQSNDELVIHTLDVSTEVINKNKIQKVHRKKTSLTQKNTNNVKRSRNSNNSHRTNDFDISLASSQNNVMKSQNLNSNPNNSQSFKDRKVKPDLANNSFDNLDSDFDININSNLANGNLNQQSKRKYSPKSKSSQHNHSMVENNNFERNNTDLIVSTIPNKIRNKRLNAPQKKRGLQNKNSNEHPISSQQRNSNLNAQIETVHSGVDLGHLTSDFSSNI